MGPFWVQGLRGSKVQRFKGSGFRVQRLGFESTVQFSINLGTLNGELRTESHENRSI
jgi:hypothetical protein